MTSRSTGYYVVAVIDAGTANQRMRWLVGPFTGARGATAAMRMIEPTRRAAMRTGDPLYQVASFTVEKITVHKLRPGTLDYSLIHLDDITGAT